MKKVNFWIRNFFGFSEFELKGFVTLLSLMLFILILPSLYQNLISKHSSSQLSTIHLDSLLITLDEKIATEKQIVTKEIRKEVQLVSFDPNTASYDLLLELGFSPKIANRLIRYRNKGGSFRKKTDLKKIYGLKEEFYQQLEPFIAIPSPERQPSNNYSHKRNNFPKNTLNENTNKKLRFDLNIVDTAGLKKIYGIGDILSQRIIKFRDKLGGFIKLEQIREVYGLKPEVADKLLSHCYLGNTPIRRININEADISTLKTHPYISPALAKAIINYREQHGKYRSLEELFQIKIINSEILNKIAPYLSI